MSDLADWNRRAEEALAKSDRVNEAAEHFLTEIGHVLYSLGIDVGLPLVLELARGALERRARSR